MSDFHLLLTLWCFVCACVFFVWVLRWATAGISRWAQAPNRPRDKSPPAPDPAKVAEEERAQHRRENARTACLLLFLQHAPEIGTRFSRAEFDAFVAAHLHDGRKPEEVEQRARQLQAILFRHLRKIEPEPPWSPDTERATARLEASRFYLAHAELLRHLYPPELFRAFLRLEMSDAVEPAACWAACQKLINALQPLVERERERRQGEDSRRQERDAQLGRLDREIADVRADIERWRQSPMDPDVIEPEVLKLQRALRDLERERQRLLSRNPT